MKTGSDLSGFGKPDRSDPLWLKEVFVERLMAWLRVFASGAWYAYVGLFDWVEPAGFLLMQAVGPLTYLIFFVYLGISATGSGTAGFYILGNALQMVAVSSIFALPMAIENERHFGTLTYLIASPANRLAIFLGRAVINLFNGLIIVVVCLAWGLLMGLDLSHANLPGLAVTILVIAVSTSGLGLLVGSLGLLTLNVNFIINTIFFLLLFFSGSNVPPAKLPEWAQLISTLLPLSRGIQAARLLVTGSPLGDVLPLLAGELAVGAVYACMGYVIFKNFEVRARGGATLEGL